MTLINCIINRRLQLVINMSRSPSNRHGRESRSSGTECSESGSERGKTSRANGSQTGVGPSIPTPRSHVPEQFEAGSDSELRQSNERTHTDLNLRPQGFMQPPPTELVAAPGSATFGGRPGIVVHCFVALHNCRCKMYIE